MSAEDINVQIQELYDSACQDLFVGLNCDVTQLDSVPDDLEDGLVAIIDAGSDELEINIVVAMPLSVLALTFPVPNITQVKEDDLEDWASELSNQLIGRLKTKLLRHNIEITLGLPNSYYGVPPSELLAGDTVTEHTVCFDVDGETCAFHMGLELFVDDIEFVEEEQEVEDGLFESEIELF